MRYSKAKSFSARCQLAISGLLPIFTIRDDILAKNQMGWRSEILAKFLPDYELVAHRTYGFFSVLASSLPQSLRQEEEQLIEKASMEGAYFGSSLG